MTVSMTAVQEMKVGIAFTESAPMDAGGVADGGLRADEMHPESSDLGFGTRLHVILKISLLSPGPTSNFPFPFVTPENKASASDHALHHVNFSVDLHGKLRLLLHFCDDNIVKLFSLADMCKAGGSSYELHCACQLDFDDP
ncbi:hypothetical protein LTR08_003495 [Meristemomyces frigidus]|nr:hypothetical protein LTR08_003495 [Meristemomyces frigidus]